MTNREKFEAEEKKKRIYYKNLGRCEVCQLSIPIGLAQLAHRIPKSKMNLKKYGKEVIHSYQNLALVCSLKCNSKVNIGNNPGKILDVLSEIAKESI